MSSKASLFEYVVIHHPKPRKDEHGNTVTDPSKLITNVERTLATSSEHVSIQAARSIPDEYINRLDEVEIVVRNF
jgi:CxxC motif-containing protein